MNWEAIGAIGEIVGAVGVIATLAFLAFQIRQNTRLLRTNTAQLEQNRDLAVAEAIGQSNSQQAAMLAIATSDELSTIIDSGLRSYSDLNRSEKLRFSNIMGPLMGSVATQWERQLQLSIEIQEMTPDHLLFALDYISTPGGLEWWQKFRVMYPAHFRESVDTELASRNAVHQDT